MNFTGCQFISDHAGSNGLAGFFVEQNVQYVELVIELDTFFDAVLIEGLQDHVTCTVSGVAGPADSSFTVIAGVTTETTLVNATFRCAVKRQSHLL